MMYNQHSMIMYLTPRAPSARYVACEWCCVGAVGEITRRAETPGVSPSATNLSQHWPAVPCHGKFHLPRSPMSGCKTSCHEITAEISVAIFLFIKSLWGLPFLSKINYFDGPHIEFVQWSRCAYRARMLLRYLAILIWNIKMILPLCCVMTSMYTVSSRLP